MYGRAGSALLDAVAWCDDIYTLRMGVAALVHELEEGTDADEAMALVARNIWWLKGLR